MPTGSGWQRRWAEERHGRRDKATRPSSSRWTSTSTATEAVAVTTASVVGGRGEAGLLGAPRTRHLWAAAKSSCPEPIVAVGRSLNELQQSVTPHVEMGATGIRHPANDDISLVEGLTGA